MRTTVFAAMALFVASATIMVAPATIVITTTAVMAAPIVAAPIMVAAAGIRFSRNAAQHSSGNNCRRENHFLQLTAPVIIGYQPLNKPPFTRAAVTSVQ